TPHAATAPRTAPPTMPRHQGHSFSAFNTPSSAKATGYQQVMIEDIAIKPKESSKAKVGKTIRRNIYRWHRILGLLALVPTIFWTSSGVMHPFMSHWFKTTIAHEFYKAEPIAPADVTLQLGQIL